MSMKQRPVVFACDRAGCDATVETAHSEPPGSWRTLGMHHELHLCPPCIDLHSDLVGRMSAVTDRAFDEFFGIESDGDDS